MQFDAAHPITQHWCVLPSLSGRLGWCCGTPNLFVPSPGGNRAPAWDRGSRSGVCSAGYRPVRRRMQDAPDAGAGCSFNRSHERLSQNLSRVHPEVAFDTAQQSRLASLHPQAVNFKPPSAVVLQYDRTTPSERRQPHQPSPLIHSNQCPSALPNHWVGRPQPGDNVY